MTPTLLLHQYDTSPFSEKIRTVCGHKRLTWGAVEQPTIMPKPDLLPLTGGYRRIPVLQIGADVYCDTQIIVRVLERLHPTPPVVPARHGATCDVWSLWADRFVFPAVVAVVFAEIGQFMPQAFLDDRTKMMPGRNFEDLPKQAPHVREQLRALCATLDAQLADDRPFLLGDAFTLADASCYHPLWFLRMAPDAAVAFAAWPRIDAWKARVAALGHGDRVDVSAAEALAIARAATPAPPAASDPAEPNGLAPGQRVTVTPDDYGFDPVAGEITHCSTHEIAVRRDDPAVGTVVVHFPRLGFRVVRA